MRAAIYGRVSSDRQRERETIRTQLIELPKYAKTQKWQVIRTYKDDGISGETIADRPGFQQLLEDVEKDIFDVLLVVDLDRITRSRRDQEGAFIFDLLRTHKIKIATLKGQLLDLENEDDDLHAGMQRVYAQYEKRKFMRRTMRGKVQAARDGKRFGSVDPFGYQWIPDKEKKAGGSYEIVSSEAKVVRRVYELAGQGMGIAMIAWQLNLEGVQTRKRKRPNRKGKHQGDWRKSSVRKLLRSEVYKGAFKVFRKHGEPITIKVPVVIPPKEWDQAQQSLTQRRSSSGRPPKREYLLSKHLSCGVCEYAMWAVTPRTGKAKYSYYRCSSTNSWRAMGLKGPCGQLHHRTETIDEAVWGTLLGILKDPQLLADACSVAARSADKGVDWGLQLKGLEKKMAVLTQASADVLRRQRRGLITSEVADSELESITAERNLLEKNIKLARKQAARTHDETKLVQTIEEQAGALSNGLERASFETRRALVDLLLPRAHGCGVVIHRDGKIDIKGILPLPGEVEVPLVARAGKAG